MPNALLEYSVNGRRRVSIDELVGEWTGYEFIASVHDELAGMTYVHFSEYWEGEMPTDRVCALLTVATRVERGLST